MLSDDPSISSASPNVGPPVEVEIKIAVSDLSEARARILAAGFQEIESRSFEANVLYDTKDQGLRGNQQALRVREYRGKAVLTFKGKPLPGRHKQREELETTVGSGAVMAAVLDRLGFMPIFRYEKYRSIFAREGEPGVITVDETPLGPYLELEGPAAWIDGTAQTLGYGPEDYITASYATLYVEHCRKEGIAPTHFVFGNPPPEQSSANG